MVAWYAFPNIVWPDEIFQSLEPAHRAVFGVGVTPWEFREGTRSWLLPGMLAGLMTATSAVTSSVTAYLAACAGALSLISLAPIWALFRSTLAVLGVRGAVIASLVCACWFELVYFAPKALNEVVAGNLLACAVLVVDGCVRALRDDNRVHARTAMCAAALLALASMLRIQLAPAALGCFLYLLHAMPRRTRWACFACAAAVVLAAGLLDAITWDYPFQSLIENIRQNVIVGVSARYGVASWYGYFLVAGRVWGVFAVLVVAAAIVGARIRPLLAFCVLAVLATHIPIGHKEYRFAYPAILMTMMLAGIGSAHAIEWLQRRTTQRTATIAAIAMVVLWIGASLRGAVGYDESKTRLGVPFGPPQWHWKLHRGGLLAMKELGESPDVCGVALMGFFGIQPYTTGGYTYLHRDIPIFELRGPAEIARITPFVNSLVVPSRGSTMDRIGDFVRADCIEEVCLYRRSGSCQVMPGYSYNAVLIKAGL